MDNNYEDNDFKWSEEEEEEDEEMNMQKACAASLAMVPIPEEEERILTPQEIEAQLLYKIVQSCGPTCGINSAEEESEDDFELRKGIEESMGHDTSRMAPRMVIQPSVSEWNAWLKDDPYDQESQVDFNFMKLDYVSSGVRCLFMIVLF